MYVVHETAESISGGRFDEYCRAFIEIVVERVPSRLLIAALWMENMTRKKRSIRGSVASNNEMLETNRKQTEPTGKSPREVKESLQGCSCSGNAGQ